jgi:hypothetical protein
MAGYSQIPLVKKLGIKEGFTLYIKNSPFDYESLIGKFPDNTEVKTRLVKELDFIHCFIKSRNELVKFLPKAKEAITSNGMIWISWPKKASKVDTDVTEDTIRQECLPMDLVDVKVCAIDDTWSGLKLVIRKEKRK